MLTDSSWKLVEELFVSCSPADIDNDLQRAEVEVEEIVNRTGLSHAQRKRLRADIIKAGLHGYGQIAQTGESVYIIIQMYMKTPGLVDYQDSDTSNVDIVRISNQQVQTETISRTQTLSGWGYFLIERVADRVESTTADSSYMIEIFLYREG